MTDFSRNNSVQIPNMAVSSIGNCSLGGMGTFGNNATASGAWPAANLAIYVPFTVDIPITVVQMFTINGATANGNIDIGIYDTSWTLLVNKTSTAQSGTNTPQKFDITDTLLDPGRYFMALCSTSGTGTFFCHTTAVSTLLLEACGVQQEDRAGSAPTLAATATPANPGNAYLPVFGLMLRSVI